MSSSFPSHLYADVAPLSAPLANHLYRYWQRHKSRETDTLYEMIKEVREKQRHVYFYLDSYVRNNERPAPRELRFTTELVRKTMGLYTPDKQPIPPKTFSHWLAAGFLRMRSKGYPEPDSAAALVLLRMLMETKALLPESMDPAETWWCYAQAGPADGVACVPLSAVSSLPSYTLLWTGWAGAAWDQQQHWLPIGDGFGAICLTKPKRPPIKPFASELRALLRWKPEFEALYQPNPGCERDEVQALEHLALVQLARSRIMPPSMWGKERQYAE